MSSEGNKKEWTPELDEMLKNAVNSCESTKKIEWKEVAARVPGTTARSMHDMFISPLRLLSCP